MSYTGHVYGDSSPYQFKIPSATEEQDGVMTKEQVRKLDSIPTGGGGSAALAGDVTGPLSATLLSAIDGIDVDTTGHAANDVLAYNGTNDKIVARALADGINAFSITTVDFTQPAVGDLVAVTMQETAWIAFGQVLYVEHGGYYQAASVSPTQAQLLNIGYPGNALAGANVPLGSYVSPAGLQGPATTQSYFGNTINISGAGGAPFTSLGINVVNSSGDSYVGLDGKLFTVATSFTTLSASIEGALSGAQTLTVQLARSTNDGASYSVVASLQILPSTSNRTVTFAAVTFPAGSLQVVTAQVDNGSYVGPIRITAS